MHNFHRNYFSQSWGCILYTNWSGCQFLRSDKRDRSSTWRSANSTRSVVSLCSCCMTLTARTRQVSTAACGAEDHLTFWARCDWQPAALPFPPAVRRERKWLYAQAAQQRCADENEPVNASENARRRVRLQACTQRPRQSRMLLCVQFRHL